MAETDAGAIAGRRFPLAAWIAVLGVCGAALAFAAGSYAHRVAHGQTDFLGLLGASIQVREAGRFPTEHGAPYPPSAHAIYQVYAVLPVPVAAAISFALATALYVITAWWLVREATGVPSHARREVFFTALALTSPWIASDLSQGNISSWLAFSAAGSWVLAMRGRPWLAGLVLSVGLVMKPIPFVILFYFAYKRMWRVCVATVLMTAVVACVAPMLMVGLAEAWRGWVLWYDTVGRRSSLLGTVWFDLPLLSFHNGSAVASVMRVFGDSLADEDGFRVTLVDLPKWALAAVWYGLAAVVLVPALWVTRRPAAKLSRQRLADELALFVVLMLFFSPLLMSYYLAITLVPMTILVGRIARTAEIEGRRDRLTTGFVGGYAVSGLHMVSRTLRAIGGTVLGLLLLWLVLLIGLVRDERSARCVEEGGGAISPGNGPR